MEKLVKKAQKGDKDAFCELIMTYKNDLYKMARARIRNEEDICDTVQETILAAYAAIGSLKNTKSFKSWLFKILNNKCNDFHRKKGTYEEVSFESNECENYIESPQISDSNFEFDNLMKVLTKEERMIILLYYQHGYNSNEIAEILDIKPNTIRSKLQRARDKIKNKGELKL